MVERRRTPPETLDQVLQKLVDRYSMFEAVELVRSAR
jgi:hypothetical protein